MNWRRAAIATCLIAAACASAPPPELATFPNPFAADPDGLSVQNDLSSSDWRLMQALAPNDHLLRKYLLMIRVGDAEIHATLRRYGYLTLDDLLPHAHDLIEGAETTAEQTRERGGQLPLSEVPVALWEDEYTVADNVFALRFAGTLTGKALLLGQDVAAATRQENETLEAQVRRGEALFLKRLPSGRGMLALSRAMAVRGSRGAPAQWKRAIDEVRAAGDGLLWQALVLRAVDALTRGDLRPAIDDLELAVADVETSRQQVRSRDIREHGFARKLVPYGLIVACLARAGRAAEAEQYASLSKARSLHDSTVTRPTPATKRVGTDARRSLATKILEAEITEAELLDLVGDENDYEDGEAAKAWFAYQGLRTELHAQQAVDPRPSGQLSAATIPAPWIALDYFLGADRLHIWIVGPEGLLAYRAQKVDYDDVFESVDSLRNAIVTLADYEPHAVLLYDLLIAPVEPFIGGKDLIVIPHQVLHFLPFEVLRHGGRFLVESHTIAYAPALGLVRFSSGGRGQEPSFLGIGDSRLLTRAATEIKVAREMFARGEILLDRDAGREALLREAPRFDVIHVATHVDLSTQFPLLTRIRFGGGDAFYLFEVPDLRPSAKLVVLSGCDTSLGRLDSGDEVTALGRAFLENGVAAVVVSLWKVKEGPTAQFMQLFYGEMQERGVAGALASAKRQMLDGMYELDSSGRVDEYSHPFYWSAFIALGDAGP